MTIQVPVVDLQGNKVREIEVNADLFDSEVRKSLLKEAHLAYWASQRQGTAVTKSRGQKAGGRSKPWRQKGTGRARQGTIRAAQFAGGYKAHSPKEVRDWHYRLPKKQRTLARLSSLRYRLEQNAIVAVEGIEAVDAPKTKTVAGLLKGLGLSGKGALLVSDANNNALYKSARNIQKVDVLERRNLCAGTILRRPNLVISAEALDALVKEVSA